VEFVFRAAEPIILAEDRLASGEYGENEFFDLVLAASGSREVAERAEYERLKRKLLTGAR
jgi:hypothetical protein